MNLKHDSFCDLLLAASEVWRLAAQGSNGFDCTGEEVFNYGREATTY